MCSEPQEDDPCLDPTPDTDPIPMTWESRIRNRFVEAAFDIEGLGYAPSTRDRYLELVAPVEQNPLRNSMGKMSGCALVVRGLWRRLGIHHPKLDSDYIVGHAVTDVVSIATGAVAWRTALEGDPLPQPGDVFMIENPEHVATVVSVSDSSVVSIDGGQRDANGYEMILRRVRVVIPSAGGYYTMSGSSSGRRPLVGFVDCVALAKFYNLGATKIS